MRVLKRACGYHIIELTDDNLDTIKRGIKSSVKIEDILIEIRRAEP